MSSATARAVPKCPGVAGSRAVQYHGISSLATRIAHAPAMGGPASIDAGCPGAAEPLDRCRAQAQPRVAGRASRPVGPVDGGAVRARIRLLAARQSAGLDADVG